MKSLGLVFALLLMSGLIYSQDAAATESQTAQEKPAAEEKPAETQEKPADKPAETTKPAETQTTTDSAASKPKTAQQGGGYNEEARLLGMIDSNPKNPEPYQRLLRIYTAEGKHKEKLRIALKMIQNIEGSANLYIIVGDENKYLGDYAKALISYQFALRMQASDSSIYNRIGLTLLKLSNFNQAEASFKAALFFATDESGATKGIYYNNLAVAYEAMKDLPTAYKYFQIALKNYPSYETAADNLTRVRQNMKASGMSVE